MKTATRSLRLALIVAAVVAVVDQVTKAWADRALVAGPCTPTGDECIDLFWTARFHLHYNPGAAFSTGRELGPLFGVLAIIMSIVLFNLARNRVDRLGPLLLGAIAGGAIGNLVDRIRRAEDGLLSGSVVDFIDFQWWPIFNVADMAVVGGVIIFIIYSLLVPEAADPPLSADEHEPERLTDSDEPSSELDADAESSIELDADAESSSELDADADADEARSDVDVGSSNNGD